MAQRIQTFFSDDLDGSEAEGTVLFGLDGSQYEIDLNAEHAKELRGLLARYVEVGRKLPGVGRKAGQQRRKPSTDGINSAEVREWAKANSIKLNDRGRIPAAVIDQYKAAAGK